VTFPEPAWLTLPIPEITFAKSARCQTVGTRASVVGDVLAASSEPCFPPLPICNVRPPYEDAPVPVLVPSPPESPNVTDDVPEAWLADVTLLAATAVI